MINAEWLLLLIPTYLIGFYCGDCVTTRMFKRNSSLAHDALKHAEAYAEYKRKIKESSL
jgi:hypothetical protein